jgi:hypothetical protein
LIQVGGLSIVLESTPKQFSGISLRMTVLFNLVGSSVDPTVAGMYMQSHQAVIRGVNSTSLFPSSESSNLIFLMTTLASLVTFVLIIYVSKRVQLLIETRRKVNK